MSEYKRWLSLDEQIAQLKVKGVQFSIMDENAARDYLFRQNNYFRITAYRRNFQRHPGGPKMGQYVRLEFAYLVDLAGIDRVLRDLILGMALDIEHLAKMEILQLVEINVEDGYSLVRDFVVGMDDNERRILDGEIARNRHNIYCGDMVRKYEGHFPIWVFLELLSFGKLCSFYRFCAERYGRRDMVENYYRLRMCQILRNAAAHESCILNDLTGRKSRVRTDEQLSRALAEIPEITKGVRLKKMSNERVQQITTLLFTYRQMAQSGEDHIYQCEKIKSFVERLNRSRPYYSDNSLVDSIFEFIEILIDKWYDIR